MEGEDDNTVLPREAFNFLPHLQQVCTGRLQTHTHTHSRSQQILKHLLTKLQSLVCISRTTGCKKKKK